MTPKRLLDVLGASMGLVISFPVLAAIAIALKCEGGSAIFRQQRVGQYGKLFTLLKFRTMHETRIDLPITIGRDPRITRVGRHLRWTKLDEIPQLINVLRGEMSLVGPRPEVPTYMDPDDPLHRDVLRLRPGLTDPASLLFWNESELLASKRDPQGWYRDMLLPQKQHMSVEYAKTANVLSDIRIIIQTVCKIASAATSRDASGLRNRIAAADSAEPPGSIGMRLGDSATSRRQK